MFYIKFLQPNIEGIPNVKHCYKIVNTSYICSHSVKRSVDFFTKELANLFKSSKTSLKLFNYSDVQLCNSGRVDITKANSQTRSQHDTF